MIEKWLKLLAGYIVDAAFAKLEITSLDDLIAKLTAALKAEFGSEIATLDALPQQVIAAVTAVPAQIISAIQNLNPFK